MGGHASGGWRVPVSNAVVMVDGPSSPTPLAVPTHPSLAPLALLMSFSCPPLTSSLFQSLVPSP